MLIFITARFETVYLLTVTTYTVDK